MLWSGLGRCGRGQVERGGHLGWTAEAKVTMFWACFSDGMSIMLPRKVNAPCGYRRAQERGQEWGGQEGERRGRERRGEEKIERERET